MDQTTVTVLYRDPGDGTAAGSDGLPRGTSIGRFVVLDRIGGGGMGVVYAVYDPELDRKLAVKLLRADLFALGSAEEGRLRLRREAQALARLAHPNVVTVHDVGTHRDQVFVAMELIDGTDLRRWQVEASRPWRLVLDVYLQAGRGLAAAHEAGLVHRDFKPSNAILGRDGRVRVLDFGLARPAGGSEGADPAADLPPGSLSPASASSPRLLGEYLTEPGVQLGTPAYMAPEQRLHLGADERSDQFGFCAALYEALYGELPFRLEEDPDAFAHAVRRGEVRAAPAESEVPAWLRQVLLRGLSGRPEARYPSMRALLTELGRDPTAARRRRYRLAGLAVLSALALWGLLRTRPAADQLCQGGERRLEGVWDKARRTRVRAAFLATGVGYAETVWSETVRLLDDRARRWATMRTDACEATHRRGEQSEELLDLRMSCLDDRLRELDVLVGVLLRADVEIVRHATEMTSALGRLETCADADLLRALVPPPETVVAHQQAEALRKTLAEAKFLREAIKYEPAVALAERALEQARAGGYAPVIAEAANELGGLYRRTDRHAEAVPLLVEAAAAAESARHDEVRLEALLGLVWSTGIRQARHEEGQRWLDLAHGLLTRLGAPPRWRNRFNHAAALLHLGAGSLAKAADEATAAVAGGRAIEPFDAQEVTQYLSTLGHVQLRQERLEEARSSFEEAVRLRRAHLGESHPLTGAAEQGLGTVLSGLGRYIEALEHLDRALAICIPAYGPDSAEAAIIHAALGDLRFRLGEHELALEHHLRALEIRRALRGGDHADVAKSLNYVGLSLLELGRLDAAQTALVQALEMSTRLLGHEHPQLISTLLNLGRLRRKQGRPEEARACYRRAEALATASFGAGDVRVAQALVGMGESFLQERRWREAVEHVERAVGLLEARSDDIRSEMLPGAEFLLARALDETPGGRPRALAVARRAHEALARLGETQRKTLLEIERWLAERMSANG